MEQAGLLRTFDEEFQIQAMKDNMTIQLFPTRPNLHTSSTLEIDMRSDNVTLDPNDSMEEAMH